jgi:hypothetical protein
MIYVHIHTYTNAAEQIHASRKQINKNNNNKYGEESIYVQGNKCHTPQQLMQHTSAMPIIQNNLYVR